MRMIWIALSQLKLPHLIKILLEKKKIGINVKLNLIKNFFLIFFFTDVNQAEINQPRRYNINSNLT